MAKPQTLKAASEPSTISREEMLARLEDRALVIVNVMPKETFADGHIPRSINIPVAEIETKVRQLVFNLAQEIAIYCAGPT
jgi:rhodanese-related sulfurtransferase